MQERIGCGFTVQRFKRIRGTEAGTDKIRGYEGVTVRGWEGSEALEFVSS